MKNTIKLAIGYDEPRPVFHLRRISEAEERTFLSKFADSPNPKDPDAVVRHEADLTINGLAEWSDAPLTKAIGDATEPFYDGDESSPAEQVRKYFAEAEAAGHDTVRMAKRALIEFQIKLQPSVDFF